MQHKTSLWNPAAANNSAQSLVVPSGVARSGSTGQWVLFCCADVFLLARSLRTISSTSTRSFARVRFFFSFSQRFARIFTYVLIAPMTITPATAQYKAVGTCTTAISSPI